MHFKVSLKTKEVPLPQLFEKGHCFLTSFALFEVDFVGNMMLPFNTSRLELLVFAYVINLISQNFPVYCRVHTQVKPFTLFVQFPFRHGFPGQAILQ
jgi:hypothetical protein